MRVVCIGECMVEFSRRPDGAYARAFAGDVYNTAVRLKRAAADYTVQFATVTGTDPMSADMRGAWAGEGIDASLAFTAPGLTPGLYIVETDPAGERRFSYWRGQSAARLWLRVLEREVEAMAGADLVFVSGISLAILEPGERPRALALLRALRPRVGKIAFDPNLRPALWDSAAAMKNTVLAAMGAADIVLPSADDAQTLWGEADPRAQLDRLLATGAGEVALTLGAEGCMVAAGGVVTSIAAPPARVVDTAGAGDAFNAAYIAARLGGAAPPNAAAAGLALAAHVVGQAGALAPVDPGLQENP